MLYDELKSYSQAGIYPFHMPGHKRNFYNEKLPFELDITEIDGFDNLQNPSGVIKQIEDKAAKLYGVNKALISVNGSTCGVLAAVKSLVNRGDRVLAARNCHSSVYHAIELFGLKPEYILPDYNEACGLYTSVSADKIREALDKFRDISLVILTSPTYEGACSDIKTIAEICHSRGARLFVDEAHGAHFPLSKDFPSEAVKSGADAAVASLHKTLPAMTQTALLLTDSEELVDKLKSNLSFFQTSSPSYILMASVEMCLDYIENRRSDFEDYTNNLNRFYRESEKLSNLKILKNSDLDCGFDIGKLVIITKFAGISGIELAKILREKYKIETEMSSLDYVIAMTSVRDTMKGFERLITALKEIDSLCIPQKRSGFSGFKLSIPEKSFFPFQAENYFGIKTGLDLAENKTSLEYVRAYPPGIPLLVPGEIITKEAIALIKILANKGIEIISSQNNLPYYIFVAEIEN